MPGAAWVASEVKAISGAPAARAAAAAAAVSPRVSGPAKARAPSARAERAASIAPVGLPPVSRGSSSTRGSAWSNRASCAAFSMASPSDRAPPLSGSSSPTRARGGPAGRAGARAG